MRSHEFLSSLSFYKTRGGELAESDVRRSATAYLEAHEGELILEPILRLARGVLLGEVAPTVADDIKLSIDDHASTERGPWSKGQFRDALREFVGDDVLEYVLHKMARIVRGENGGGYVWNERYEKMALYFKNNKK